MAGNLKHLSLSRFYIPVRQEEQGIDHKQNRPVQQLQNCCFGEDVGHFEEQQFVSRGMELEATEPIKH